MEHKLKTLSKYYKAVVKGDKTFEVRKDDRDFQVGDKLSLMKYSINGNWMLESITVKITYILGRNEDEKMFVPEGYVILGIK